MTRIYHDLAAIATTTSPEKQNKTLALLEKLGYTSFATEKVIQASKIHTLRQMISKSTSTSSSSSSPSNKRKRTTSTSSTTSPSPASASSSPTTTIQHLQRITIQLTRTNDFDLIGSSTSKHLEKYDIIAAMPTTEEAFVAACSREDLDLIAIDVSCRLQFRPKPAQVSQAIERGVYFELRYSGSLQSETCRSYFMDNVKTFVRICRGRGIICSSASKELFNVRGHHDIANLMCLCGVKGMERALMFVSENCTRVVERAKLRRRSKIAKRVQEEGGEGGREGNSGAKKSKT